MPQTYGQLECCTRLTPTCFQTIGFWIFKLFQKSSGSAVRPLLLPPTFKTRAVMVFPKPSSHHPGQGPGWHSVQWNHQRCSTMCKVTFEPSTSVCCCRGWLYCKRVWPMSMWSHPWQSHPAKHPSLSSQNCYCCWPVKYVSLLQIWTKVAVFKSESTLDIILLAPIHCQRIAVTGLLL